MVTWYNILQMHCIGTEIMLRKQNLHLKRDRLALKHVQIYKLEINNERQRVNIIIIFFYLMFCDFQCQAAVFSTFRGAHRLDKITETNYSLRNAINQHLSTVTKIDINFSFTLRQLRARTFPD